jgi:hypothetical protein
MPKSSHQRRQIGKAYPLYLETSSHAATCRAALYNNMPEAQSPAATPAALTAVPARRFGGLRRVALALVVWALVSLTYSSAVMGDRAKRGMPVNWDWVTFNVWLGFLPYVPYSLLLYHLLAQRSGHLPSPVRMLRNWALCVLIFVPLVTLSNAATDTLTYTGHLSDIGSTLKSLRVANVWTDFIITSATYAILVALASWRLARARETALQNAEADNLRLRLTMLQGQLEPHFLFNALNSISGLVRASDRATALSALSGVSDMLRYALRASKRDWVNVHEEVAFVKEYLNLQRLRFGSALEVEWLHDLTDWRAYACPPLLLQPLAENAIRHGHEATGGRSKVSLDLRLAAGQVVLSIQNSLPQPEQPAKRGHGVGLAATRERLATLYGSDASVETWRADGHFNARVQFPAREFNE